MEETSKIREYYVTKLNEHNILQIMGHELAHHISLFSDDADDAPEIALFEEMGVETIAGSESIYATYTNN